MIYVYALTDPLASPADLPSGFADAPVEQVVAGRVAAAYSTGARPDPTADNLWCHEAVVEALMERGAALPTRFGTVVDGPGWLQRVLDAHAPVIAAALDEVRGAVEVGVRVRAVEAVTAGARDEQPAASGAQSYLQRRLEREQLRRAQRDELGARARAALAPLEERARAMRWSAPRNDGRVFSAAYLVPPSAVESFDAEVARLDDRHADLELLATGPWPPYSFAPALDLSWLSGA